MVKSRLRKAKTLISPLYLALVNEDANLKIKLISLKSTFPTSSIQLQCMQLKYWR